jgi:DNA-binding transcriptional LysR family regulator
VQLRGLACGFVPEPLAREHIRAGRLVVKPVERAAQSALLGYAWRAASTRGGGRRAEPGQALRWWLGQLESPATRKALLEHHGGPDPAGGL